MWPDRPRRNAAINPLDCWFGRALELVAAPPTPDAQRPGQGHHAAGAVQVQFRVLRPPTTGPDKPNEEDERLRRSARDLFRSCFSPSTFSQVDAAVTSGHTNRTGTHDAFWKNTRCARQS